MIEFIAKYWMEVFFSGIISVIGFLIKGYYAEKKKHEALKAGVIALLHDRLYQSCQYYINRGWVTIEELKNLEYLYRSYHELGGNGTGTEIYERTKDLPIKKEN